MKKLPKIELHQLVPGGWALSALGFALLHTNEFMNIGAILLPLGLLPTVFVLSKYKD